MAKKIATKKSAKKTDKKAVKKIAKKTVKKIVKKAAKKVIKKIVKKVTKKVAPKVVKVKKTKTLLAKELNVYKEQLINAREDLMYQIRDQSENTLMKSQKEMSGDISGHTLHMADVASDSWEREFNLNIVSGERKVLVQIDEALKRIKEKAFGFCACGKMIKKARLKAIPYALHCLKCQDTLEKENRI